MKKLTAGILATLIGLVSANSADASVASTNYVDEGLETKQNVLADNVNVVTAGEGGFVTGVSAANGVVTVTYGDQADVTVDSALNNTSENPVQNKVITEKIEGMDFSAADTTGVVQTVTQVDGAVTATYNLVATEDIADSAVTTGKIADGAVTSAKIADGTIVDADVNALSISKITDLQTELDAKQLKLNSGEGGNITVQGQEGDNVVTGISAANGVVTVTTGYFNHTDTKIADEVTADITQQEITTDQDSATVSSYSLIKYVDTATNTTSYKWELIDRVYTEQPEQQ